MSNNPWQTITSQNPPQFNLEMTDDALVTFGAPAAADAVSFIDVGLMPINALTIGNNLQQLTGRFDGLFIQYSGTGIQHFASTTPTTADYTSLHYELLGYKGVPTFEHAADGTPIVSDAGHLTILAQGDLLQGQLGFNGSGGISGEIKATFQVKGQVTGTLQLNVNHSANDVTPTATGFTLDHGSLQATYLPLI